MSAIGSAANAPTTARSAPLLPPVADAVLEERVLDPVPLGAVALADAEVEVAVPFRRIALRYTGGSQQLRRALFGPARGLTMNPSSVSVLDSLTLIPPTPPRAHVAMS